MVAAALAEVGLEFAAANVVAAAAGDVDCAVLAPLEQAHTTAPMTTRQPSMSVRVATTGVQYCQEHIGYELIEPSPMLLLAS